MKLKKLFTISHMSFHFHEKIQKVFIIKMGDLSIGLPKNSPYKVFMNNIVRNPFENGKLKRLQEKWEIKEPSCVPLLTTGDPLSLEKLISIFLIGCIGFLLSFLVFVYELCLSCTKQIRNDEKDVELLHSGLSFTFKLPIT